MQNYFDSGFGDSPSTTTGAPGSDGNSSAAIGIPAGTPTTELVTPTPHSFVENSYNEVAGIGAHDGVADSANHHPIVGESPNSTGAGEGTPGYKNGRS